MSRNAGRAGRASGWKRRRTCRSGEDDLIARLDFAAAVLSFFFFFPARAHDARSNAGDDEKVYNDGDSDELQAVGVGKKKTKKQNRKSH